MKYKLINQNGKMAIFDVSTGKQVSNWWHEIYATGLLNGSSEYYMVKKTNLNFLIFIEHLYAIFHISNPNEPVSNWWNQIYANGLLQGKTNYYKVKNDAIGKSAIFHINDPDIPVSEWWTIIYNNGIAEGDSEYYIVRDGDDEAIFHINDPDRPISKWWTKTYADGLVDGKSIYYLAKNYADSAIFHRDEPNTPASGWWDEIYCNAALNKMGEYLVFKKYNSYSLYHINDLKTPIHHSKYYISNTGLIKGDSDYVIIADDNTHYYICSKDSIRRPISQVHRYIYLTGLVEGISDYYVAIGLETNSHGLFHKNNPSDPIGGWFDEIADLGLVIGESNYYFLARRGRKYAIFHKLGMQLSDWMDYHHAYDMIYYKYILQEYKQMNQKKYNN